MPEPDLVIPAPVPETVAETVRSATALLESPMLNVRVAPPRSRLPERVAPSGLPVLVNVTLPPRVRVPAPVLTTALYARFSSRGDADFQDKLLSAMRYEFGGHREKS